MLDSRQLPYNCLFKWPTRAQWCNQGNYQRVSCIEHQHQFWNMSRCFADKPVVGEHYYRTIEINVIIHLNTGINMLTLYLEYHYLDYYFAPAKFLNA